MIRDEIVSQEDLLEAVTHALDRKGTLQKVKAHIRAEVYHTLEDKNVVIEIHICTLFVCVSSKKSLILIIA